MRTFFRDHRGQALVEFALVLPLLILLLLMIMEGGRLFAGYLELQSATRDAVRYVSVNPDAEESGVKNWVDTRLTLLDPDNLRIIEYDPDKGSGSNKWVKLKLEYSMQIITPMIGDLIGDDEGKVRLSTDMAMRIE